MKLGWPWDVDGWQYYQGDTVSTQCLLGEDGIGSIAFHLDVY